MSDSPVNQPAPAAQAAPKLPSTANLIVSSSPHFHAKATVTSIMAWVVAAMLPAVVAGCYFFGWTALRVVAICTIACVAFEVISAKAMKRPVAIKDLSAVVTGLLLAMNLPSSTPWWICIIGAFMAVVVGKMIFGGIGCNPFNPALVGRVALLLAFPTIMTTWPLPKSTTELPPAAAQVIVNTKATPTGATPLKFSKVARAEKNATQVMQLSTPANMNRDLTYVDLLLGRGKGGSLGETCALAILLGGILLICLNIIRWHIPVFYLGTVIIITGAAWLVNSDAYVNPIFHLLTGGLMLGAFFMATDMVTTPLSRTGAVIFAIGCGILTSCIRLWGNYPEGVSFSILIMNAFTPLIDRYTAGKPFGMPKKKGVKLD